MSRKPLGYWVALATTEENVADAIWHGPEGGIFRHFRLEQGRWWAYAGLPGDLAAVALTYKGPRRHLRAAMRRTLRHWQGVAEMLTAWASPEGQLAMAKFDAYSSARQAQERAENKAVGERDLAHEADMRALHKEQLKYDCEDECPEHDLQAMQDRQEAEYEAQEHEESNASFWKACAELSEHDHMEQS